MRRHRTRSGLAGMAGRLRPYAKSAKRKAGPVVEETWEHVAPAVEQARERMSPVVESAREKASTTLATAVTASEPYRKEAQKRGSAAWLALRGELEPAPPKKKHWFRRILVLGGLGGAAVAAYRVLRNGSGTGWQPTPATMPNQRTEDEAPDETGSTTGSTEGVRPVVDAAEEADSTEEEPGKHTKSKPTKEPAAAGAKKPSSRSSSGSSGTNSKSGDSKSSG